MYTTKNPQVYIDSDPAILNQVPPATTERAEHRIRKRQRVNIRTSTNEQTPPQRVSPTTRQKRTSPMTSHWGRSFLSSCWGHSLRGRLFICRRADVHSLTFADAVLRSFCGGRGHLIQNSWIAVYIYLRVLCGVHIRASIPSSVWSASGLQPDAYFARADSGCLPSS